MKGHVRVALMFMSTSGAAWAAPSPADIAEAQRQMDVGASAYGDGSAPDCGRAYPAFKRAYELSGSVNALRQMGICALEQRNVELARQHFEAVLADPAAETLTDDELDQVERDLATLPEAPPTAPVPELPTTGPAEESAGNTDETANDDASPSRPIPAGVWATGGVTVIAGLVAGGLSIRAVSLRSDYDDENGRATQSALEAMEADVRGANLAADVAWGITAAAGATTALWYFFRPEAPPDELGAIAVTPDGALWQFSGRF